MLSLPLKKFLISSDRSNTEKISFLSSDMNEFDKKAGEWDSNQEHWDRSAAIVNQITELIPLNRKMTALEFGAGTGIAGFLLRDKLKEIILLDSSPEMVRIINEKIDALGTGNIKTLLLDLEKNDLPGIKVDLVMTQLALHHVTDVKTIIGRFYKLLKHGGYLAVADLYTEDGSFHGAGFSGHKGFDPKAFSDIVRMEGFKDISFRKCFVINKKPAESNISQFDVFLLVARKD